MDCGYSCHEKCIERVPKNCTKYKSVTDSNINQTISGSGGDNGSVSSGNVKVANLFHYIILRF